MPLPSPPHASPLPDPGVRRDAVGALLMTVLLLLCLAALVGLFATTQGVLRLLDYPVELPVVHVGVTAAWWVLAAALALWVHRDAPRHRLEGSRWAVLVFVTLPVGLVVYLLMRENPPRPLRAVA